VTTSAFAPPNNAPTEAGTPNADPKTGDIRAEYVFPEAGEAEVFGEVVEGASLARVHSVGSVSPQLGLFVWPLTPDQAGFLGTPDATQAKTHTGRCRASYINQGKRCVSTAPVKYGLVKLFVPQAGTYKIAIKPTGKVLAALKNGRMLDVRVTLVFTPAGTTTRITKVSSVSVHIKARKKR
jgi:hypothetical protein